MAHFTDPAMLAGLFFISLALLFSKGSQPINGYEKRIANWLLFNGGIIHLTMDGLTGGHHLLPLLYKNYCILDKRFLTDEVNAWIITQIELWLMCPLCFVAYLAFRKGSIHRFALAIVISSFQIFGAFVFAGSEIIANFPNVPVDRKFEFTKHYILYFWFGFGANLIWVFIPILVIFYSMKHIAKYEIKIKSS